ncbi:hypothetical protein [Mesonia aquimarina]|uniref:hypothetical protein n=1 Tax=Mesonia aquimarina TaxID=1504967 RepID=UPI000EF62C86|nr:hypothetical protein [Mesonia aquimarina]
MKNIPKILTLVSVILLLYWLVTKTINIYDYVVLGAIYELTSLIAVAATFLLPIFSLVIWGKSKFSKGLKYFLPIFISIGTIFVMIFL